MDGVPSSVKVRLVIVRPVIVWPFPSKVPRNSEIGVHWPVRGMLAPSRYCPSRVILRNWKTVVMVTNGSKLIRFPLTVFCPPVRKTSTDIVGAAPWIIYNPVAKGVITLNQTELRTGPVKRNVTPLARFKYP